MIMTFVIIDPSERLYRRIEAMDLNFAMTVVGLKPGEVDHGVLMRLADGSGIGYVVYEFCFFVPPAEQHYFSLNAVLMAGPAVLYQFDELGKTTDFVNSATIVTKFYDDAAHVEHLIGLGVLKRPQIKVNGEVIWSWPDPAPPDLAERVAVRTR